MPERTCIGCRTKRPQAELVRVVRTAEGELLLSRTAPGRGAWVCHGNVDCLDQAIKRRALARALRGPVTEASATQLRSEFRSP